MAAVWLFIAFLCAVKGGAIVDKTMKNLGSYSKFSAYYELNDRPRKIALLIDDMQEEYRSFSVDIVESVGELLSAFRGTDLPVFWSYWDRTPTDGIHNAMDRFYGPEGIESQANALYIFEENGADILHELAPKTEIEKSRSFRSIDLNMFWNFDENGDSILEKQLKELQVDTIALVGAWTDECILSTATNGFSRDYDVLIVSDAVDTCTPYHRTALEILSAICCKPVTTQELVNYVTSGKYDARKSKSDL
eukprot:127049_1